MAEKLDTRRLFLAALLSLGVLLLWQWVFPSKPPVETAPSPGLADARPLQQSVPATSPERGRDFGEIQETRDRELVVADREEIVEIETDQFLARLSNRGGQLLSLRLLDRIDTGGEPLEMVRRRSSDNPYPFAWVKPDGAELALNRELFVVDYVNRSSVRFRYSGPLGMAEKSFDFSEGGRLFAFDVRLDESSEPWALFLGPGVTNPGASELGDRFKRRDRRVSFDIAGELSDLESAKVDTATDLPVQGLRWVGLEDKYFLTAWMFSAPVGGVRALPYRALIEQEEVRGYEPLRLGEVGVDKDDPRDLGLALLAADNRVAGQSFWGAKEYTELRKLPYGLANTVRFGMFGFLAKPLLYGIRWLHANVVANYGWCIVIMTLLIKIALFPLTHKGYVSMKKLQLLNPQMEAIRGRYRPKLKDKQGRPNLDMQRKMNEEIQGLFKKEGVSPAGGCLPLLLQMPVFLAFYRLLSQSVELWNAPWAFWIADLAAKDPIYVLPLVMGATQLLHTKLTPAPSNPSQKIIMTTMPIWFTVFALGFPSGLVLYWLTNNVLTILQQEGYNRLKKAGFFGGPDAEASPKDTSSKDISSKERGALKKKGSANA